MLLHTILFCDAIALMPNRYAIYYFLPFCFIFIGIFGFFHHGQYVFSGALSVLILHPIIDTLFDFRVPKPFLLLKNSMAYQLALYLMLPVLFFLLITSWKALGVASSEFEIIGIILSSGLLLGAFGIATAHELVHRKEKFEVGLGLALLALVNFTHFAIFHIKGHHKNVGTKEDSATAILGEGLYSYWLRAVPGEWVEAYNIEQERLSKKYGDVESRIKIFLSNRVVQYHFISFFLFFVITSSFGLNVALAWILQSVIAILMLTTIDYVEHYGLQRAEVKPGVYEPVRPWHSWDSIQMMTNFSLFNLGLHSDHHLKVQKPYNHLDEVKQSNILPYGYSVMFLMALIPPLYKRKMNTILNPQNLRVSDL